MTQQANNLSVSTATPGGAYVLALKIAVAVMGIMIFVGLAVVIGRIVYLASTSQRQAPAMSDSVRLSRDIRLALPAGSHVRQVSLSGDRLAVHYETATGTGIAVVNLVTGVVLSRIEVAPELPR